jgi:hypothetical protein
MSNAFAFSSFSLGGVMPADSITFSTASIVTGDGLKLPNL